MIEKLCVPLELNVYVTAGMVVVKRFMLLNIQVYVTGS